MIVSVVLSDILQLCSLKYCTSIKYAIMMNILNTYKKKIYMSEI